MADQKLIQSVLAKSKDYEQMDPEPLLEAIMTSMNHDVVQANSLGAEDVVILHMMHKIDPRFKSFTLDTGRLNPETYEILDRLRQKFDLDITVTFPEKSAVEKMVRENGINLFYDSIEKRKLCCQIRKVQPLQIELARYSGWVCGLRREQSPTRSEVKKIEVDFGNGGMLKFNPLADWTSVQVWNYIKANGLPYNKLHDQGFASIGCAPCTRAIKTGEPERAGRWWWENPNTKECGLHQK